MTRKKLNAAYITNESKRNATYRRRKNGLIKKVDEINTLCGIEACVVIANRNDARPEVWPVTLEAQSVIDMFMAMPEEEKTKKMLDQEAYLRERIKKAQEELKKQREENKKNEMILLMNQLLPTGQIPSNISTTDLNNLSSVIDERLKEVEQRIDWLKPKEVAENVGAQAMTAGENMGHSRGLLNGGGELTNKDHAEGSTSNMNDSSGVSPNPTFP